MNKTMYGYMSALAATMFVSAANSGFAHTPYTPPPTHNDEDAIAKAEAKRLRKSLRR